MAECSTNCPHLSRIAKLETQFDYLAPLINKMDGKIDQVILGLSRVEVLESKHFGHGEALGRAFERIESVEQESLNTSKALADLLSQIKAITRLAVVLWTVLGGAVGYIASKVV
jgi:hypothetical protein